MQKTVEHRDNNTFKIFTTFESVGIQIYAFNRLSWFNTPYMQGQANMPRLEWQKADGPDTGLQHSEGRGSGEVGHFLKDTLRDSLRPSKVVIYSGMS